MLSVFRGGESVARMSDRANNQLDWQLSERGRREILRRWPNIQLSALEEAARLFRIDMNIHEESGDKVWEDEMARLAKTSTAFLEELENAKWTVFSFGRVKFGARRLWLHELMIKILRVFVKRSAGYNTGAQQKDRRYEHGPRANFILVVSRQLQAAGYGVSARANDDLVRVLDLLFCESGHPVSDPRKTVAHVLKGVGAD